MSWKAELLPPDSMVLRSPHERAASSSMFTLPWFIPWQPTSIGVPLRLETMLRPTARLLAAAAATCAVRPHPGSDCL